MDKQKIPAVIYRLDVKRPVDLLRALFDQFSGDQTLISLDGDLSYVDSRGFEVISQKPIDVLSPNAISPKGNVVLVLNSATKESFEKHILSRAGIHSRIYHILITISGEIVFASYDNFSEGCAWVTANVSEEWLNGLLEAKIIKGFEITKSSTSEGS